MSLKLCNYSKRIQCHFYIEYHRMVEIFYIIKHVFHFSLKKKNQTGAELSLTTIDIAV